MMARPWNILVLCADNSANSILAEALLNALGGGRLCAYSAGTQPADRVSPYALELLDAQGLMTDGLRSKSLDEFTHPTAPTMDLVITVGDAATAEAGPSWLGQPLITRWDLVDPAAMEVGGASGAEIRQAYMQAYAALAERILTFLSLSFEQLDRAELEQHMTEIGRAGAGASVPNAAEILSAEEE